MAAYPLVRILCVACAFAIASACTPTTQQEQQHQRNDSYTVLDRNEIKVRDDVEALDEAALAINMTFDQVEERWGDTDCVYRVNVEGRELDAWGYGVSATSGEVVGLNDCGGAKVSLFFFEGLLVAWGEQE